tara:strand:- start:509 stop:1051 length:543 start_codon:yes stop_codon:yes gene_type:complete
MFNKKEILIWIVVFIVGVFMAWSCRLEAIDIQKLEEPIKKEVEGSRDLYPNFLLYNSTQSCMRGIVQMLIQFNPQLRNQLIPAAAQQQILGHCSCVVDKIRVKYSVQEYYNKMSDYIWIRDVWGGYGTECMKAGYLAGLGIKYPEKEETKVEEEDNKTESPKPESKVEEKVRDEPTIFQG